MVDGPGGGLDHGPRDPGGAILRNDDAADPHGLARTQNAAQVPGVHNSVQKEHAVVGGGNGAASSASKDP